MGTTSEASKEPSKEEEGTKDTMDTEGKPKGDVKAVAAAAAAAAAGEDDNLDIAENAAPVERTRSAQSSPGAFAIPGIQLRRQERLVPPRQILVNASIVDDEQPTIIFEASPLRRKGTWKWILTVSLLVLALTLAVAIIFMQAADSGYNNRLEPPRTIEEEPRDANTQLTVDGPVMAKSEDYPTSSPSLSHWPSATPTQAPSLRPSTSPTDAKSKHPSGTPSTGPSEAPSRLRSEMPSETPTQEPSYQSSEVPSSLPSLAPSSVPTMTESAKPSLSIAPSLAPSAMPSNIPSQFPTSSRVVGSFNQIGQTISGDTIGEEVGRNVKLSNDGTVLAVSSHLYDSRRDELDAGRVQVFKLQNGLWVPKGRDIVGDFSGDQTGYSMDLSDDGSIVAVGSWTAGIFLEGTVRMYQYNTQSDSWDKMGQDLIGESTAIFFGTSLSLSSDGQTVAIGADLDSTVAINAGRTQIFRYEQSSNRWKQFGQTLFGQNDHDRLGSQVVLAGTGDVLALGIPTMDGFSGSVKVFAYDGRDWTLVGSPINDYHFDGDITSSIEISYDGLTLVVRDAMDFKVWKFDASAFDWIENTPTILPGTMGAFSLAPNGHSLAVTKVSGWFGSETIFVDIYKRKGGHDTEIEWDVEKSFLLPLDTQPVSMSLLNHDVLGVGCPDCSSSLTTMTRSAKFGTSLVVSF